MTVAQLIDYRDGPLALQGELFLPAGPGPHPGVIVMHSALGLSEQVQLRARSLANLGYAAFASDMYGKDVRDPDPQKAGEHMVALQADALRLRRRAAAGLQALADYPTVDASRLAAIGFCFGGQCVLELARHGADIKAAVSYHGLLSTQFRAEPGAIRGRVAVFTGAKDPYAPAADVEALRAELTQARAVWHITEFGEGYHAFMGPEHAPREGLKYDPLLDALSWASTLVLLDATLRDGTTADLGAFNPPHAH
jgi:dienelactone hydrolase